MRDRWPLKREVAHTDLLEVDIFRLLEPGFRANGPSPGRKIGKIVLARNPDQSACIRKWPNFHGTLRVG